MHRSKSAIWEFFQTGPGWIFFGLGANELLAMLEGKIGEASLLKVLSGKITV